MLNIKDFMLYTFNRVDEARKKSKQEVKNTEEMISLLDIGVNGDNDESSDAIQSLKEIIKPNGPMIYAFTTSNVPNAIKVGYTTQHVNQRIDQWRKKYDNIETLGWWPADEFSEKSGHVFFMDYQVHDKLNDEGYHQYKTEEEFVEYLSKNNVSTNIHRSREFFNKYCTKTPEERAELSDKILSDLIELMHKQIKDGTAKFALYKFESLETKKQEVHELGPIKTYDNTDLQETCIKRGIEAIDENKTHLLMSAVMRFGKTHATYEIIARSNQKLVLVTSAKADVRESWRNDINHKDFIKGYGKCEHTFAFVEFDNEYNCVVTEFDNEKKCFKCTKNTSLYDDKGGDVITKLRKKDYTVIVFATLQDLSGSSSVIKKKHEVIMDREFDMLVVDETHYGSHADKYGKAIGFSKNSSVEYDDEDTYNDVIADELKENFNKIKRLDIDYKVSLQVSGTPYYILASNEFNQMFNKDATIIADVSYTDILKAHDKWIEDNENKPESANPYFGFPKLHKIGLQLTKDCRKIIESSQYDTSFVELFKVNKNGKFEHEAPIQDLMTKIFGDDSDDTLAFLKNKVVEGSKVCKHTIMILPRISSCVALKKLLDRKLKNRDVICIVGNNAEHSKTVDELNTHLAHLEDSNKKSLILTVNKFLTGVSMPLVDSIIYLKNTKSPQEYDQAIFRMCTRNIRTGVKDGTDEKIQVNTKDNVYLIDFNVTTMFNMIAKTAMQKAKLNNNGNNPKTKDIEDYIKEELKYMPIYGEGVADKVFGKIHHVDYNDLMKIYTNYNVNKSIDDSLVDEIEKINALFKDSEFIRVMKTIPVLNDKGKTTIQDPNSDGGDVLDIDDEGDDKRKSLKEYTDKIKPNKENDSKQAKEKTRTMLKRMLLCNLCLKHPQGTLNEFIDALKKQPEMVDEFFGEIEIDLHYIERMNDAIKSPTIRDTIDSMFLTLMIGMDGIKDDDVFIKKLGSLGRIGRSEFVTPASIVKKMIDKCEDVIDDSSRILLVNEKQCEFLSEIKQRFGQHVANNCRIVASGQMTRILIGKMLNHLRLSADILINIPDVNNNNKYDLGDFLQMNNKEFLKDTNETKPFDVCLMNPPYSGINPGDSLYIDFINKSVELSDKLVVISPLVGFLGHNEHGSAAGKNVKLHSLMDKYKPEIEETKNAFDAGIKGRLGITFFDKDSNNTKIKIKYINGSIIEADKQINLIDNDNEYLRKFKSHIYKFMIGEDTDKFINLKYPAIYKGNDKSDTVTFIHDNLFNHLYYGKNGEGLSKFTKRIEQHIDKDKYYVFLMKPNANFGEYLYKETYNKGIEYNEDWFEKRLCYIKCDNIEESENICDYLKTDFCRLLLKLRNNYYHLYLKYDFVPWLDFSKSYNDDELFEMIGMKYDKDAINKILVTDK